MARKSHADNEKNIKAVRHEAVLRLIAKEVIGTQELLAKRLNEEGYDVTQATVSRDIKELNLVKKALIEGGYRYQVPRGDKGAAAAEKFHAIYSTAAIRVDNALNQVVLHCYSGMANAVCVAMDAMGWEEIIGSIAGDDTILIITPSEKDAKELTYKLRGMMK